MTALSEYQSGAGARPQQRRTAPGKLLCRGLEEAPKPGRALTREFGQPDCGPMFATVTFAQAGAKVTVAGAFIGAERHAGGTIAAG